MVVLCELPNELFREILNEWLQIKSVGQLDRAISDVMNRTVFLEILAGGSYTAADCALNLRFFTWTVSRKMKIERVLYAGSRCKDWEVLWSKQAENIRELSIRTHNETLAAAINICKNLTSLTCNVNYLNANDLDASIVSKLKFLTLKNAFKASVEILHLIAEHCFQLQHLNCKCPYFADNADSLMKIIRNNSELSSVHLEFANEHIKALASCSHLAILCTKGTFDYADVVQLIFKCKYLTLLEITEDAGKCKFDKKSRSLTVEGINPKRSGWHEFTKTMCELQSVVCQYSDDISDVDLLRLVNQHIGSLTSLSVAFYSLESASIQWILESCLMLARFSMGYRILANGEYENVGFYDVEEYYVNNVDFHWPEELSDACKIEFLTIQTPYVGEVMAVMRTCRYLSNLTVNSTLNSDHLYDMEQSIRKYTHAITGARLNFDFVGRVDEESEVLSWNYYGKHFTGNLHWEYAHSIELQKVKENGKHAIEEMQLQLREAHDRIKQLEEEIYELKKQNSGAM